MKKNFLKLLNYLPFLVFSIFYLIFIICNEEIDMLTMAITLLFLFFIPVLNNNKKTVIWAKIVLIIFTIWYVIMGNFDYFRWTSTLIGCLVLSYYLLIFYISKRSNESGKSK